MKGRQALWLLLVLSVTALNTWAAYMVASYAWSMVAYNATIFAGISGFVTFVLARIIVSS